MTDAEAHEYVGRGMTDGDEAVVGSAPHVSWWVYNGIVVLLEGFPSGDPKQSSKEAYCSARPRWFRYGFF